MVELLPLLSGTQQPAKRRHHDKDTSEPGWSERCSPVVNSTAHYLQSKPSWLKEDVFYVLELLHSQT